MISAPTDVPGLEGEEEWGKLTGALDDLIRDGLVEVDRLEAGTLAALQRPLRLREYHVLHFIGHGGWDEDAQDGALALEGADRKARLVTGRDLGLMIRGGRRSLRLVVLNACEGARSARDDPFGGVAQALVRQGIPAVIAMQFEISDPAALVFSQSFYQAIADGLPVDVATLEARRAMFAEGNEVEWATPVLYLRSPDGQVFTRIRISQADRQAREEADRQAREEADRLTELDPAAADPDGLTAQARQRLEQGTAPATPAGSAHATIPAAETGRGTHHQLSTDIATTQPVAGQGVPRLARTLTGHKGWRDRSVTDVTFSPDGRLLASCSEDKTVRLWDPATGKHRRTLAGHTDGVTGVAFSPDGRLLASSSEDDTVRLWDPATGEHRRTVAGHTNSLYGVAFSPDGRLLASCGADGTARVWDPATGGHLRTLTGHTYWLTGVAFSPDGRLLASGGINGVQLWDPATGKYLRTLTGHTDRVKGVAFSPDGRLLASCGQDGIRLWDPATGEHRRTLAGRLVYPSGVAFSPDGRLLASGGEDDTVRLWDPATGESPRTLAGHTSWVEGVAFSPDGRLLASSSEDKTVRLWAFTPADR